MTVGYEWDIELTAIGDIVEHFHGATLREVLTWSANNPPDKGFGNVLVLVRDDDDRRAWAYPDESGIPRYFEDADGREYARVPKRFHEEHARNFPKIVAS